MGGDFFSNFWKGGDFVNEFGKPWFKLISKLLFSKQIHQYIKYND